MKKSALLSSGLLLEAMKLAKPSIEAIIRFDKNRNVIYVVILDPVAAAAGEFEIMWNGAIGEQDRSKWKYDYSKFAEAKARISFEHKMPSHLVQREFAHMYQVGDFKYGGSDYRRGIIVAASGLAWHLDYAVSSLVAGIIDGLVKGAFEVEYARAPFFVGALDPES